MGACCGLLWDDARLPCLAAAAPSAALRSAVDPVPQVASAELRTLLAAALHLQHVLGAEGTNAADGQDEPEALHGTVRLMELLVEARHVIRHAVLVR